MNLVHVQATVVALGLLAAGCAGAEGFADRATLQALSGVYTSSAPEPWYGGYGTRRFTFANGQWGLEFTHALDPEMAMPTFRFRTEGPFEVGAESQSIPGAYEAIFYEDAKFVTLLTTDAGLVQAFGFADCGLQTGVEVDISVTGCAAWMPVSVCREDHDLLAMDATGLFFGVRPADNDMCTADRRPTALLPAVVLE